MKHSIVIPAHNESINLENFVSMFVDELCCTIPRVKFEVLIVENGSTDSTLECANRLKLKYPDKVEVLSNERGSYGEAIKRGIQESTGVHLSILECDFLDVSFVAKSISLFNTGKTKFIVASKRHPESIDGRPLKRRVLTNIFNQILRISFAYPGTDTHGLKSIDSELAKELCRLAITTDEIFQTEIVLIAWRLGEDIIELPIQIKELRSATVSIRRRFPMVLDLIWQLRRSLKRFPPRTPFGHYEGKKKELFRR
jgi:glycosyltransferase involved in cell wall biosynthesis